MVWLCGYVGSGGHTVERRTVNRADSGSIPPTAGPFRNLGNLIHPTFETLKAGSPFHLVSMPGEVKDPTQGRG